MLRHRQRQGRHTQKGGKGTTAGSAPVCESAEIIPVSGISFELSAKLASDYRGYLLVCVNKMNRGLCILDCIVVCAYSILDRKIFFCMS